MMSQVLFRPFFVLILLLGNFKAAQVTPPPNDNLANAQAIAALPFTQTIDVSNATLEPNEYQPERCLSADRTVWYSFVSSEARILRAETQSSITSLVIYAAVNGSELSHLYPVQCILERNPTSIINFPIEPGYTYYIQTGFATSETGPLQLSILEPPSIFGRVTDPATGWLPLYHYGYPRYMASLLRVCGDACLEKVNSMEVSVTDGRFWFENSPYVQPGTYMIEVTADLYYTEQFGPFRFDGTKLDVGDLAIDRMPTIGSIRGRMLDKVSGKPISQELAPIVFLYHCQQKGTGCVAVNNQFPDNNGWFQFDTGSLGEPLVAGIYYMIAAADQYHANEIEFFEVKEGESLNMGTVRLRSFPVRFTDITPCETLPASGGVCEYSVRVWNGLSSRITGKTWSTASVSNWDAVISTSSFQVREPRDLTLERGKSKIIRFRLKVPAISEPANRHLCMQVYVGWDGNPFFNPLGSMWPFCMEETPAGFVVAPSAEPPAQAAQAEPEFGSIGSIRGRAVDAVTGAAIPGAWAVLEHCGGWDCIHFNSQRTDSEGNFYFDSRADGAPLSPYEYQVYIYTAQYQVLVTAQEFVAENEHKDLGDLPLTPWPVQFTEGQACAIPSEGGVCEFSATVTNRLETQVSGRVWSIVSISGQAPFETPVAFQPDLPVEVRLQSGESRTVRFRFRVRGAAPDGVNICFTAYMGQTPNPYFQPVGYSLLFCVRKGADGLTPLSPEDAQATFREMQRQDPRRTQP